MIAYFDCFSGISGDMTLGALLDLGVPPLWLKEQIALLNLGDIALSVADTYRHGIRAKQVTVHGPTKERSRNHQEISQLIGSSSLSARVIERSLQAFDRLAAVEADIHGVAKDDVHFHEVGGVDAIVDIVGAMLGLEYLGISRFAASPVSLGTGLTKCHHGVLPVPAPATLALLKGIPVSGKGTPYELVTPTGAAILTTVSGTFGPFPSMTPEKIGYGAGTRDLEAFPNLLRVVVGHPVGQEDNSTAMAHDQVMMVETGIDDMNPELCGHVMERLFEEGALDVCMVPVYMKKNRPGFQLQVLCPESSLDKITERIFKETTTLGVRYHRLHRRLLPRSAVTVETRFGTIAAKQVTAADGTRRIVPEYDSCRKIALENDVPLYRVYEAVAGITRR